MANPTISNMNWRANPAGACTKSVSKPNSSIRRIINWFDFKVAPEGEIYIKVTDMFDTPDHDTHQLLFQGKGLPEALILEAQRVYPNKIIISDSGGALWAAGRVVWQRLVDRKLAKYEREADRYVLKR